MDFRFTTEQELLRRSVREFAEAELRPHVMEWDEAQHFPSSLLGKCAELGLMGIQFPEAYGGAAMSAVDYCICIEELARVDPSVCLSVAAHNGLGASHIFMFGNEAQKQKYLVPLASGRQLAAWALTEATSGSDAASMRTTAMRDGDCWVINGTKQFITHGATGDVMVVMAVTSRAKGSRGISAFIVERGTPGLRAGKEGEQARNAQQRDERGDPRAVSRAGRSSARHGRTGLHQCAAGARRRTHRHRRARGRSRARCIRCREELRVRAQAVRQPIGTFQSIRAKLVDSAMRIEAARLLTFRAAAMKDEGSRTTLEAAMAKLYSSEIAVRAAEDSVQIHGGYGFVKDYPAEKFFRDVKLTTIGEGTSEIQRLVIARQLLS
jgi:alkylation response protein AidB-like acyl-CoA dehydrogenase